MISIVLPDGSMQGVVSKLMEGAGLFIQIEKPRTKKGGVPGVDWIDCVSFQRPKDIPRLLRRGTFDIAIVGEDWIKESGYDFPVLFRMPIGRGGNKPVKIVLAVAEESDIYKVGDLRGLTVATEYVNLTGIFLTENGISDAEIIHSPGNTEHKIELGFADAIVDVTESGNSLRENNLRVIAEIMTSSTVIAANPDALADENKKPFLECFAGLIEGAFMAERYVLITANVPKDTLEKAGIIMGGLKSATCSRTLDDNWFALQAIILKERETKIIFELLKIGVKDIFIIRDIPLVMM